MSQTYSLFSVSKQRGDRWVVSMQFDWLAKAIYFPQQTLKNSLGALILWMVSWKFPSTQATMAVASAGLGVGLLVALFGQVLSQPSLSMAVPALFGQQHTGPVVDLMVLFGTKYQVSVTESVYDFYSLPRKQVAALSTAGRPSESQAVQLLVGYNHSSASALQKINLGDELQLVGDNNGRYSYQVIATQVKTKAELTQLDPNGASLYVIVSQSITNQSFLVILLN